MRPETSIRFIAVGIAVGCLSLSASAKQEKGYPDDTCLKRAVRYLENVMDQYHKSYDVYTDFCAAGNHFTQKGKIFSCGSSCLVPLMDEAYGENPHSGKTCIRATFIADTNNWGGWCFLNGVLGDSVRIDTQIQKSVHYDSIRKECVMDTVYNTIPQPGLNWGEYDSAGVDLRGARTLSFWARGNRGGEVVEFFAFGAGWDVQEDVKCKEKCSGSSPIRKKISHRESSNKRFDQFTLTKNWERYSLDISGTDLRSVLCGFGWSAEASINENRTISFFIDDIRFDKPCLDTLRFLQSFRCAYPFRKGDEVQVNMAHVYDNALALLAFLALHKKKEYRKRARLLADAIVYALNNDRYFKDGRIRNVYQAGDCALPPGWRVKRYDGEERRGAARMPGWWKLDSSSWYEDEYAASTQTGNVAWAMLALLSAYQTFKDARYKDAVITMANWVIDSCTCTTGWGGFFGGREGFDKKQRRFNWRSTEHNLDLYPVFVRLAEIDTSSRWEKAFGDAKRFVDTMWDSVPGKYWTGTDTSGKDIINKTNVPLDIQAWMALAVRTDTANYSRAMKWAEDSCKLGNGFDFNPDKDGIWYEGTAQMAAAYLFLKNTAGWRSCITTIEQAQFDSGDETGAIPASNVDDLTTGFTWKYFHRPHIGATAWYILAKLKKNPYWM